MEIDLMFFKSFKIQMFSGHQTIRYTQLFSAYSYDAACLCKKSISVGKSIIFSVCVYPAIALHLRLRSTAICSTVFRFQIPF